MMSSEMPSAKYSCSGSPLMLANGNTAIEGRSAVDSLNFGGRCGGFDDGRSVAFGEGDAVDPDRPCDVLDGLLAHVLEAEAQLVSHLVVDLARNHDAAGLGERLQPRGHVDAVAINIVVVADDVADVDADAELDAPIGWHIGIAFGHAALDFDGAAHSIDDADEFHQHAVAGGLDDAAPVLGDLGIDQFLAMRLELAKRAFLVDAHQPAVAGDVARENRGQPVGRHAPQP